MKFSKDMLLLYAITDRANEDTKALENQVKEALEGGVTILQLREKNLDTESFKEEALKIKELCHQYNVPLIINDRVDIALSVGADGVHVGLEDAPVSEIRKNAPKDFIIGATAKTIAQAKEAEKQGADYLGVGAIFPSPTKKNAVRITNEQLSDICNSVSLPAVAIGGISLDNIDKIQKGVANGVAVVSAIFGAKDIKETTKALKIKAKEMAK